MQAGTLQDLYVSKLQDMHNAEGQMLDALPTMESKAEHDDLRQALNDHRGETEAQKQRLEQILKVMDKQPSGATCKGMQGLIEEGEALLETGEDGAVKDAGMIAVAQQVEHYEIAAYGTLCTYAEMLGRDDELKLLQKTLSEEKEADGKLNSLAKKVVNPDTA